MKKRILLLALATVMLLGGCTTPSSELGEKKMQTVSENRVNKGGQDELGEKKESTNNAGHSKGGETSSEVPSIIY